MSSVKFLLPLVATVAVTACNNSGPSIESDDIRSLNEPRNSFVATDVEVKSTDLTSKALGKMLSCDEPTSITRLDKEKYGVSYKTISREQDDMNEVVSVKIEENTYSTNNKGETYTIGYKLVNWLVGGVSSLVQGPYAFTKPCTKENGCDDEKRVFTQGDVWTMIQTEKRHRENYYSQSPAMSYNCSFEKDEEEDAEEITQKGIIKVGSEDREAIQVVKTQKGKINCNNQPVGTGMSVNRKIILSDELPGIGSNSYESCGRTRVFSASSVVFEGKIISGESREIADYLITGKVQSVEEWKATEKETLDTRAKLENAVDVNRGIKAQAESKLAAATAEKSRLVTRAEELDGIAKASALVVTVAGDAATEEEKKKASDDKEAANKALIAVGLAEKAETEAKKSVTAASISYEEAVLTLKTFNENIAKNS